jgi:hypothetical protein
MAIGNVTWWDGSSEQTTTLKNAFLPPVSRGDNAIAKTTLTFQEGHGLNLDNVSVSVPGPITVSSTKKNQNQIEVTIKSSKDLGIYNDNLETRIFYTGMQVPFVVDVDNFSDTFYMTLGPVIAFANTVASGRFADYPGYPNGEQFGGSLKPETGQKIVLQSRAHEWYLNNDGNIVMTLNDTVGKTALNDRTVRGRQYAIVWEYNGV